VAAAVRVQSVTDAFAALGLENVSAWRPRERPTNIPQSLVETQALAAGPPTAPHAFGHDDYRAYIAGTDIAIERKRACETQRDTRL
jgi:hypothetical protein